MFGSISNWINTNVAQAIPPVSMPQMPQMPQMPKMPDLFGKNSGAQPPQQQAEEKKDETINVEKKKMSEESKPITEEPNLAQSTEPTVSEGVGEQVKSGYNIELDTQKAIGTAKEIGSNIGSK